MMLLRWRSPLAGVLGALAYTGHVALAINLDLSSTDSIKAAAATVAHGMMSFYRGNESGMSVGLLPDPYYWWEAGAMFGQMVEYWYYTGDTTYNDVVMQGLLAQIGPNQDFMPPNQTKTEGNDDQAFWAFAAMSAAEMKFPDPPPKQPSWLSLAQAVFNEQVTRWDTQHCGGGLRWQIFTLNKGYNYKNSISNGGFFQLAARLARYTGNETYAQWAEKSYDWALTTPLLTDQYLVYDGADIANNCTEASPLQWTYNVGTYLIGAANMYNYTNGSSTWRTRVEGFLNGSAVFFPGQYEGGNIMVEVACEPQVSCNNDQPSFKAYLARWMAATTQIAPFTENFIMQKLRTSATGAAGQCSGAPNGGTTCGRKWYQGSWDEKQGVGEQMSAMSVIQANLIQKVNPPVSLVTGGSSKSNPSAGTGSVNDPPAGATVTTRPITVGDRAGAGILTAITLLSLLGLRPGYIIICSCRTRSPSHHQALFPLGNKAFTFTTSSHKKRKLSPPITSASELPTRASAWDGSSSPASQQTQPLSSPPKILLPDPVTNLTSSPSPPRFIPQHLVVGRPGKGRSPTPELSSTAASSPSAAYAGLTLDREGTAETSGTESLGARDTAGLRKTSLGSVMGQLDRPSSPAAAKRPASDMEGIKSDQSKEDVNMEEDEPIHLPLEPVSSPVDESIKPRWKSQIQAARHKREVSVDMLAQELGPSSARGSASDPVADRTDTLPNSIYHTPRSGNSTTDSSNGLRDISGASSNSSTTSEDTPSIDDQIKQVMQMAERPFQEGQKGYIVATKWLYRVLSRGSNAVGADKHGKEAREGDIGPLDNSGLSLVVDPTLNDLDDEKGEPYIPLRPGLQIGEDFEILPQEAWDLVIKWYGIAKGSLVISRYCHNTSTSETTSNLQYELHPPVFTLLKLPDTSGGMTKKTLAEKDAIPIKVLASRHELFQEFLRRVKNLASVDLRTKVRVWRILGGLGRDAQAGLITPAQSRSNSPAPNAITPVDAGKQLCLDVYTFAELQLGSQREQIEAKDETANEKYNGHSTLDVVGLRQDEVIVLEEQIGGPAGGEWVSDAPSKQAKANGVPVSITKSGATTVRDTLRPKNASSGRTSPAPGTGGMMTRGRAQKNRRTRGMTGLNNLGNTCYMNSALQCIRSIEELTQYFLQDKHRKELNPSNPLSHNGEVAKAYASLLKEMFSENATSSFAPRNFKNVIGKYGPSFSGYGQQDSQEFLLFLLDGLQEDLNRIQKKPYVEKPDSTDEMVNDPMALRAMADKCWEIYQARNDSVITDLFAGMYKSTVICPDCNKVSIIFDPFNNLTLQLPIENLWSRIIFFFPLHSRPIQVSVDIDKNASFAALKEYVAGKAGIHAKRTVVAEIYKNRIYKMFDDKATIGEERIAESDHIAVFELEDEPTNCPPQKKKRQKIRPLIFHNTHSDEESDVPDSETGLADKMLVAVFNRQIKDGSWRYQHRAVFGVPSYIIVTRDEARNHDAILQKVLAKVETMTTRDFLREDHGSVNDSAPEDSDTVLMATDEDSSSDSKVQATSLESEDGMIDISMRDSVEESQSAPTNLDDSAMPKLKPLARMLQPGSFITPEVRNLFEMKYFSSGSELIPTGWSTLQDENKDYPTIASRMPEPVTDRKTKTQSKLQRRLQRLGSASSSDEDIVEDSPAVAPASYFGNGSGSDSDGLPPVQRLVQHRGGYSRSNKRTSRDSKKLITYSRKGKDAATTPDREEAQAEMNNVPLIQLGEAIVLDWSPEAYDALFTGTESTQDDELRGAPTWESIPTMPDPELEERRKRRASRKRNGISLGDCLDEFGKPETLSENDAWYCPRCKEHRRASKTFELWKAPDILVIHLKRFSVQGRFSDKLDIFVDFPVEGLDLSSRVAMQEEGKSPIYDLFAVDNHYGGLGGGHYTAFAQNFIDKNWYDYNDSAVMLRNNTKAVVTPSAYLLFYRRRGPQPLGGPFFEQLINAAQNPSSDSHDASRTESPAGEGKRLDDSSRNGSSSALRGVGAIHQAGGGGLTEGTAERRTGVDDELPGYEGPQPSMLESMELEEDEGISGIHGPFPATPYRSTPNWSFDNLTNADQEMQGMTQVIAAPPGSDQDQDEDLFDDGVSAKAASSPSSGRGRLLADFAEDEGTTAGAFGTPVRGGSPEELEALIPPDLEESDGPVAELPAPQGEDMFKMD